jgi:putative ABC transport system substrate-binding protein
VARPLAWPLAARAQIQRIRRIGVVMEYPETDRLAKTFIAAFRDELRNLGWVEGQNVQIDYRWTSGDVTLRQKFVTEVVAQHPDLIISMNTAITASFMQRTRTIPIVFTIVGDPVGSGFVAGLSRPGGNITGFTAAQPTIAGKMAEFLKEIAPGTRRVALLFNPPTQGGTNYYAEPLRTIGTLQMEAALVQVFNLSDIESAVAAQALSNGGVIVMPDAFTTARRADIIASAARYHVPAVYPYGFSAEEGGLMSYGIDMIDNYRHAASYADRILKGTRPSELPVQAPSRFVLTINLKTAKALGLTVGRTLLARADKVIE